MQKEIEERFDASNEHQLNLSRLNIDDEELPEILLKIKEEKPNLRELFLDYNRLSDKGAKMIAKELALMTALRHIDLQFNMINEEGASAIYSAMSEHSAFKLSLAGNEIVDAEKMARIEEQCGRTPGY